MIAKARLRGYPASLLPARGPQPAARALAQQGGRPRRLWVPEDGEAVGARPTIGLLFK
jgi:hypothetical protein